MIDVVVVAIRIAVVVGIVVVAIVAVDAQPMESYANC